MLSILDREYDITIVFYTEKIGFNLIEDTRAGLNKCPVQAHN